MRRLSYLNKVKWTEKALRASALKYKTLKDWRLNEGSAYATASRLGLLPKVSSNLKRKIVHGFWTKKRILFSAKGYKYRGIWAKACSSAYSAAKRMGILELATKHMGRLGNRKLRCVYKIFVKSKKTVYVGLTYNFERRIRDHFKTKRFRALAAEFGRNSIIAKRITGYIDADFAAETEKRIVKKYKRLGYILLNIAEPGALGGNVLKWTNRAILKEAKSFTSVKDWFTNSPNSYAAASVNNLILKATKHMRREIRRPGSWTRTDIRRSVEKFKSFSEWIKFDYKSYSAAQRMGLLDDNKIVGHLSKRVMPSRKWYSPDLIKREALKFSCKSEWKRFSSGSYKAAHKLGIFKRVSTHMQKPVKTSKWNIQSVCKDAKKYSSRSQWRNNNNGAYQAAKTLGCLDKATKHMPLLNQKGKWTFVTVLKNAKGFISRSSWSRAYPGAYEAAKKNGWFEKAVSHMKLLRNREY